jgi:hypothetical protein
MYVVHAQELRVPALVSGGHSERAACARGRFFKYQSHISAPQERVPSPRPFFGLEIARQIEQKLQFAFCEIPERQKIAPVKIDSHSEISPSVFSLSSLCPFYF